MAAPAYSRYDYTQWGTGLQSQGLSTNPADVYKFYQQVAANPNTAYNKGILSGVQAYGKNNKGSLSDPNYITNALDWYWRDIQRKSQKAPTMFGPLDSIIKPALTIGASIINPALGAAVGGVLGAANGGGLLGGALGALGGYGAGGTLKGIGSALGNAGGLSTLLKAPGTFASNLGRGALTSIQNYIPGYGGSLTSAAGGLGSILGKVPTGAISSVLGGNNSSSGGGNMSFFGDLLTSSIPSLIGGGIQYLGASNALEAQQKAAAQLAASGQFNPYNVSGPAGSASFSGNNATAQLSPEMQAQLAQMSQATQGAFSDYTKFNAGGYAKNYYDTITSYKQPLDQANTNELLNRVYATGNWGSTTGAQDVYSYQQAKNMEDNMLRIQAQQAGASEQDRLFNRYFQSAAAEQGLATLPYQFLNQGASFGGAASSANISANQYPWLAAQNASDASSAFWSTIGSGVIDAGNAVLGKYSGYQKNANRPITTAPSLSAIAGYGAPTAASWFPTY